MICECLVRSDDCIQDQQALDQYLRDHDQKQLQNLASGLWQCRL